MFIIRNFVMLLFFILLFHLKTTESDSLLYIEPTVPLYSTHISDHKQLFVMDALHWKHWGHMW